MEATTAAVKAATAAVATYTSALSCGANGQDQDQQDDAEFAHKHPLLKGSTQDANKQSRSARPATRYPS
jgi:hypothetical protein